MRLFICVFVLLAFSLQCDELIAQPFNCPEEFILAVSPDGESSRFFIIEFQDEKGGLITFNEFSEKPGPYLNAIGYRPSDNYIYGIAPNTQDLYRLDATGNTIFLHHFEELDDYRNYNAGAVTLDSKFLVILSGISTSAPLRSEELILIDLQSPDYELTKKPLTTLSGEVVYSLDIAFDPITNLLYGYDSNAGRLLEIQLTSGQVDDVSYPITGIINTMAAMFFDAFGNLYGYAKHHGEPGIKALYQINKNNGSLKFLLEGPFASGSDGCSCPARVELLKSVEPVVTTACSEVEYTFKIANSSNVTQSSVQFLDIFPSGFKVLEVTGNIYGGEIQQLNTDALHINDMVISPGIDSFKVRVFVGGVSPGVYKNQAVLNNLASVSGSSEVSDNPMTLVANDSTALEVLSLTVEEEDVFFEICPGDTLQLDATRSESSYSYSWDNGLIGPVLEVTEAGSYEVVATNECETLFIIYHVVSFTSNLQLDLGEDVSIYLGERFVLDPDIPLDDNLEFQWSESNGQTINCSDCSFLDVFPTENTIYSLVISDEHGCTVSDDINVIIEKEYNVYVPNSFSPNGDGLNDYFTIYGNEAIIIQSLQVFNRWGGLVFESFNSHINDDASGWSGKVKGVSVRPGVYVWITRVNFIDGVEKVYTGNVSVIH